MTSNKNSVYNITSKKISTAIDLIGIRLPSFNSEIKEKLTILKTDLENHSFALELEKAKKVFEHPQIESLIILYIQYLLLQNIFKKNLKNRITYDKVVNKVISVIETHFADLSDEASIYDIVQMLNYMFNFCNSDFKDCNFKKIILEDFPRIFEDRIDAHIRKLTKQIEFFIEEEFIFPKRNFDGIKNHYNGVLKRLNQNGFIYLLGEYGFDEFYIPPILIKNRPQSILFSNSAFFRSDDDIDEFRKNWIRIFDSDNIIYVIGGAGFGKSLFLKNLINNYSKLHINKINDYLVIYCDLKTYYTNGDINKKTVLDFLEESMINITGVEQISKDMIDYYLKMGRCLILLDALDEVPKTKRNELHKKIVAYFSTCNPSNKICITSRSRGFIPQEKVDVMEILPLTFKDIEDYINKMIDLKKFKKSNKRKFLEQAKVLVDKNFLNNFLVLSLLVSIYKAEKALPENKIDLYKKCFEYIAKIREEENSNTGYNWEILSPILKDSTFISLSVLAAPNNKDIDRNIIEERLLKQYKTKYSNEAQTENAIKEFLDFCSNRTELFVPASVDDKFKFFHRSFFEYFYSRYIYQQSDIKEMYNLMSIFDIDSEIFELTVALVKNDNEEKYQNLIEYIFGIVEEEFNQSKISFNGFKILTMAMQVVDDAYYISKYFDLIIEKNQILDEKIVYQLNQKIISICINKVITKDECKKDVFISTYANRCVCYFLEWLSYTNRFEPSFEEYLESSNARAPYIIHHNKKYPFFVRVFSENDLLFDLIEKQLEKPFKDLCNYDQIYFMRKKRSQLKKGYDIYKKYSSKDIKRIIKFLADSI